MKVEARTRKRVEAILVKTCGQLVLRQDHLYLKKNFKYKYLKNHKLIPRSSRSQKLLGWLRFTLSSAAICVISAQLCIYFAQLCIWSQLWCMVPPTYLMIEK